VRSELGTSRAPRHASVRGRAGFCRQILRAGARSWQELQAGSLASTSDGGSLYPMTTEPRGASCALRPLLAEAGAPSRLLDAQPTRGVAAKPTRAALRTPLRQSVPSTTAMTLSKDPGMMRVGHRGSATWYLGAQTLAPWLLADGQLGCWPRASAALFCHGTLSRTSHAAAASATSERATYAGAVVVNLPPVIVKQAVSRKSSRVLGAHRASIYSHANFESRVGPARASRMRFIERGARGPTR
jgi:hypothetical protein